MHLWLPVSSVGNKWRNLKMVDNVFFKRNVELQLLHMAAGDIAYFREYWIYPKHLSVFFFLEDHFWDNNFLCGNTNCVSNWVNFIIIHNVCQMHLTVFHMTLIWFHWGFYAGTTISTCRVWLSHCPKCPPSIPGSPTSRPFQQRQEGEGNKALHMPIFGKAPVDPILYVLGGHQ